MVPNIRFSWLIHYNCNYRCNYCFYYEGGGWELLKDRTVYLTPDKWMSNWNNIYSKYGRCAIIITGGEPFIYPNFIELISRLSQIHFPINISSNASGDLFEFVNKIDCERVSLSISFQPQFDRIDNFLEKLAFLRKHKFDGCVNLVAYPPFLKDMEFYRSKFLSVDKNLEIIPFRGIYKEMAYPWSYTDEELNTIGIKREWLNKIRKKGTTCTAGQNTALLLPDGTVVRCGQAFYRFAIGNFFDNNFELLKNSLPCDVEVCPCEENLVWGRSKDQ